jgi:hypothetical protein
MRPCGVDSPTSRYCALVRCLYLLLIGCFSSVSVSLPPCAKALKFEGDPKLQVQFVRAYVTGSNTPKSPGKPERSCGLHSKKGAVWNGRSSSTEKVSCFRLLRRKPRTVTGRGEATLGASVLRMGNFFPMRVGNFFLSQPQRSGCMAAPGDQEKRAP